jgi:hypothetical protein
LPVIQKGGLKMAHYRISVFTSKTPIPEVFIVKSKSARLAIINVLVNLYRNNEKVTDVLCTEEQVVNQ